MTHASVATAGTRFAEGDFRVGRVLSRTISVLSHRFLTFFIVSFVAFVPLIVLQQATASVERDPTQALTMVPQPCAAGADAGAQHAQLGGDFARGFSGHAQSAGPSGRVVESRITSISATYGARVSCGSADGDRLDIVDHPGPDPLHDLVCFGGGLRRRADRGLGEHAAKS